LQYHQSNDKLAKEQKVKMHYKL